MRIKIVDGLIWHDNQVLGTIMADRIAKANGYQWAEGLTKAKDGQEFEIGEDLKLKSVIPPLKAIILTSSDGQEYASVVLFDSSKTYEQAGVEINQTITDVQATNPDEWTLDDIQAKLIERGFIIPEEIRHGPQWD